MIDISKATNVNGWMLPEELTYLAQAANKSTCIAEIGAWKGRSTVAMAANTGGVIHTVDTWKGSNEPEHINELKSHGEDWLIEQFKKNVEGYNVIPHQMTSLQAARMFAEQGLTFDMIFIDASHDYENVKNDILAWAPLLTEGGIFCGHDYNPGWPGVRQAVDENISNFRVAAGAIWTTEVS